MSVCSVGGCQRPVIARGWCTLHYQRWKAHGDPERLVTSEHHAWPDNLLRRLRFMPSGCIEFTGALSAKGYGRVPIRKGKAVLAHRAAYEMVRGPIPEGAELHHTCRNKPCVNPGHLEPLTPAEHADRHREAA